MIDQDVVKSSEKNWLVGSSTYQMFILGLSIYAILSWLGIYLLPLDSTTKTILISMNRLVSLIFLYDFFRRLFWVNNKLAYLKLGWLDFLSGLPWFPILAIARLGFIIRARRYIRKQSGKSLFAVFRQNRAESALLSTFFSLFILILISSILVLDAESAATDANILNADDAIWWSFVTVTTVGYGDRVPVTSSGRVIGMVLMSTGIALVAVLTGYVTNAFTPKRDNSQAKLDQIQQDLNEIKQLLVQNKQAPIEVTDDETS